MTITLKCFSLFHNSGTLAPLLLILLLDNVSFSESFVILRATNRSCPVVIGYNNGSHNDDNSARASTVSGTRFVLPTSLRMRIYDDNDDYDDSNDEYYEDDDNEEPEEDEVDASFASSSSSDWVEAEFTLANRGTPTEPRPELDAATVANLCCRSLQWVDYPTPLAGLKRCYEFFMPSCREVVTARQGGKTMNRFLQYGVLAPALQPFMGASRVTVRLEEATMIDAKPPLRGAMWTAPVDIHGAPVLSLQHPSGIHRSGIATAPPITNMVLRLEQQRRPPYQGCWMVREILDVRHAFAGDLGNAHVGA